MGPARNAAYLSTRLSAFFCKLALEHWVLGECQSHASEPGACAGVTVAARATEAEDYRSGIFGKLESHEATTVRDNIYPEGV